MEEVIHKIYDEREHALANSKNQGHMKKELKMQVIFLLFRNNIKYEMRSSNNGKIDL